MNDYSHHWFLDYLDTTPGFTCANCKFANEYVAYWWYPHIDPACSKRRAIAYDKPACGEFELMGRMSR